jgi:hypothetical protein
MVRKKFRAPVTTARSFFAEVACAATKAIVIYALGRDTGLKCHADAESFEDEISYDPSYGDVRGEHRLDA